MKEVRILSAMIINGLFDFCLVFHSEDGGCWNCEGLRSTVVVVDLNWTIQMIEVSLNQTLKLVRVWFVRKVLIVVFRSVKQLLGCILRSFWQLFYEFKHLFKLQYNSLLNYSADFAEFCSYVNYVESIGFWRVFTDLFNLFENSIQTVGLELVNDCPTIWMAARLVWSFWHLLACEACSVIHENGIERLVDSTCKFAVKCLFTSWTWNVQSGTQSRLLFHSGESLVVSCHNCCEFESLLSSWIDFLALISSNRIIFSVFPDVTSEEPVHLPLSISNYH